MELLISNISLQMVSYFQRQTRVILEKWNSKRTREKLTRSGNIHVNDIYDITVWDRQLDADAKSFITASIMAGGNEFALLTSKELEVDEELVAAGVIAGLLRVREVNRTTRTQVEAIIQEGISRGKTVEAIAEDIRSVFDTAIKSRAKLVAANVVSFGLNEGQMIEASKAGYKYKVWISRQDEKVRENHTHADGQARPLYDPFIVGSNLMMHPGDLTAPLQETANCRCTMVFTNNPNPRALAEFGVDPDELERLRDASVIARLIRGEIV